MPWFKGKFDCTATKGKGKTLLAEPYFHTFTNLKEGGLK